MIYHFYICLLFACIAAGTASARGVLRRELAQSNGPSRVRRIPSTLHLRRSDHRNHRQLRADRSQFVPGQGVVVDAFWFYQQQETAGSGQHAR